MTGKDRRLPRFGHGLIRDVNVSQRKRLGEHLAGMNFAVENCIEQDVNHHVVRGLNRWLLDILDSHLTGLDKNCIYQMIFRHCDSKMLALVRLMMN